MKLLTGLFGASLAVLASWAQAAAIELPARRIFVGQHGHSWALATVPVSGGMAIDYRSDETKLDNFLSFERATGAVVYDLRSAPISIIGSEGFDIAALTAATEFPFLDQKDAKLHPFLLRLTAGAKVYENPADKAVAVCQEGCSFFYDTDTILAAKEQLLEHYHITWSDDASVWPGK